MRRFRDFSLRGDTPPAFFGVAMYDIAMYIAVSETGTRHPRVITGEKEYP